MRVGAVRVRRETLLLTSLFGGCDDLESAGGWRPLERMQDVSLMSLLTPLMIDIVLVVLGTEGVPVGEGCVTVAVVEELSETECESVMVLALLLEG